jgi:hypothetical protein
MERLALDGQPLVAVDYAHTPDALDKALAALRPLAQQRGGQLWCVFGCGGDRDPGKRPLMAAVAEKNADRVVVTSDNPRSEKPEAIISQILLGLSHDRCVQVQADRARPSPMPWPLAARADVVLVAGKGHEDYQEVAGQRIRSPTWPMPAPHWPAPAEGQRMMTCSRPCLVARRTLVGDGDHRRDARAHRQPQPAAGRPVRRAQGRRFDANDFLAEALAQPAPLRHWRTPASAGWPERHRGGRHPPGAGPAGRGWREPVHACR